MSTENMALHWQVQSLQKTTWFTAGTFFHRIRKAKPWLAAIWLIERCGIERWTAPQTGRYCNVNGMVDTKEDPPRHQHQYGD
ncbi:MAG: hypothetical protein IPJ49_05355 [Candidatus Obscuribacter sp.]|nr:hypothetical protein [Candidatus Obscuribacter sp.]